MEKVQKMVKLVNPFGHPDQHGNQGYWIEFDDGSKGTFRTPNNDLFIVGQVAEFSIKETRHSEKAGNYAILQRYKEPYNPEKKFEGSNKSSKSAENIEQINRAVAIKAAAEFHAQSKVDREYVVQTADIFYDYIRLGIVDKQQPLEKKEVSNELPF